MLPPYHLANKGRRLLIFLSNHSTLASKLRLSKSPAEGFIEIKDSSTWRKVDETNWDENRQKMFCQYLGFNETDANLIDMREISSGQATAAGNLICYNTKPSRISCCVHLEPKTTTSKVYLAYAACEYLHVISIVFELLNRCYLRILSES